LPAPYRPECRVPAGTYPDCRRSDHRGAPSADHGAACRRGARLSAPVVLIPENPMPEGGAARWSTTPDGARLRVFTWGEGARGTVFLFNGRTEFVEKYFEVVGEL